MNLFHSLRGAVYLAGATLQAIFLGIIETATSVRGRRVLALGSVVSLCVGLGLSQPWPHRRPFPVGDQVYRPQGSYQTGEGLSIGVEVTVRYGLDPAHPSFAEQGLPADLESRIIEPVIDAILHRVLAQHSVRQIYASDRAKVEAEALALLAPLLATDGVQVRSVFIGNLDLPASYKLGLEALLAEELSAEKMVYTLELKEKGVKEAELMALAEKAKREQYAEAAAQEEIIAAKGRAEAMRHVLPLKEKEIEQKRLEAEASRVTRLALANTEAEARRIEAGGEADYRKKLAESDAYRIEMLGKASSEQMARDAVLISKNPLLIQKTLADKLSDKIQVIVAPPEAGGFFASGLIGKLPAPAAYDPPMEAVPAPPHDVDMPNVDEAAPHWETDEYLR